MLDSGIAGRRAERAATATRTRVGYITGQNLLPDGGLFNSAF